MVHPRYRSFLQAGYLWGRYDHRPSTSRGCMAVVPLSWASPAGCGRGSGGPDYRQRAARRRAARARRSSVYVLATCAFCPPALTVRATQIPGTRTCKAGATQAQARKTLRLREMQAHVEPLQHHARNGLIPHSAATAHRGDCAPNRRMRGDADRSLDALRFAHLPEQIRACLACGTCRADPLAGCPPDRKSVHPNAGLTLIRGSRGGFMRRVAGVIACAVVVLLLLPSRLAAQSGIIWGRVADTTGALLARATVSVEATGGRTTSNDQGNYEIRRVPAGTHTVRVRLLGYVAQTVRIAVSEEQTVRQDFSLRRQPIGLAPVDVVVGSRARHTGAEELAVPVDVYAAEALAQQGTSETSQILQALAASVNFPRQSVTDANDIVRPFTLRGLSPDHTLVLLNGWRRHQTALVNNFAYGMAAGSSGVDLNAIPVSAIDRIEVLRDGASAQYGSDAIAGVVNIVTKEGQFTPVVNVDGGRYVTDDYPDDGTTVDVNGGWGIGLGRGSLALFGEFLDRQPTNRAWADPFETSVTGLPDSIDNQGRVVVKRNPAPQPNHHWGDGLEKDIMTLANLRLPLNTAGTSEIYAFGGDKFPRRTRQPLPRLWAFSPDWAGLFPPGRLPPFSPPLHAHPGPGGGGRAARARGVHRRGERGQVTERGTAGAHPPRGGRRVPPRALSDRSGGASIVYRRQGHHAVRRPRRRRLAGLPGLHAVRRLGPPPDQLRGVHRRGNGAVAEAPGQRGWTV